MRRRMASLQIYSTRVVRSPDAFVHPGRSPGILYKFAFSSPIAPPSRRPSIHARRLRSPRVSGPQLQYVFSMWCSSPRLDTGAMREGVYERHGESFTLVFLPLLHDLPPSAMAHEEIDRPPTDDKFIPNLSIRSATVGTPATRTSEGADEPPDSASSRARDPSPSLPPPSLLRRRHTEGSKRSQPIRPCSNVATTAESFWADPNTVPEGIYQRFPYFNVDRPEFKAGLGCMACGTDTHVTVGWTYWSLAKKCSDSGRNHFHVHAGHVNDECLRSRLRSESSAPSYAHHPTRSPRTQLRNAL